MNPSSSFTKRTLCVLEHPEHIEALERNRELDLDQLEIYSANQEVSELLLKKSIPFRPLTEDDIRAEWDEINIWARKISLTWFEEASFREFLNVNGFNAGDLLHRPLSHALVYHLKILCLIERLLSAASLDAALVFDEYVKKGMRWEKAKMTLNRLLSSVICNRNGTIHWQKCRLKPLNRSSLKEIFRKILTWLVALLPKKKLEIPYLGMGMIRHLKPVLTKLNESDPVAFLDRDIQLNTFHFCRENRIHYFLEDSFLSIFDRMKLCRQKRRILSCVERVCSEIHESPFFHYRNKPVIDLGLTFLEMFQDRLYPRLKQALAVERALECTRARVLVLHEDLNHFRAAARVAKLKNRAAVVLSHGIPVPSSDWTGLTPNIGLARTIVNSDFERDKYLRTGYPGDRIGVLGLPRMDEIYRRARNLTQRGSDGRKILYCPHMLRPLSKFRWGFLGVHTPAHLTKQYAVSVMRSAQEAGARLWIKLHDNQDFDQWQELIGHYGDGQTVLFKHDADIFELIDQSDLVVTTFSTVVIEAMLYDKDVITMNFTERPDLHPYAEYGISVGVRRSEDLTKAILACFEDEELKNRLKEKRRLHREYFGGRFDGENTERVLNYIRNLAYSPSEGITVK